MSGPPSRSPLVHSAWTFARGAVTEDGRLADYVDRKRALRGQVRAAGSDALLVFAADKVAKARELRGLAAAGELDARRAACRQAHYAASLDVVEARLPDHTLTDLLRLELLELAMMPVPRGCRDAPA